MSWKLFVFRGIPVRVHWTLLLVLPFFAVLMATSYFAVDEDLTPTAVAWGAALAVSLFASVLLHEFSHSLMAMRFGVKVSSILLMPLGGVSQMERMPEEPKQEFLVTVVGPLTNFVIAAPLLLLRYGDFLPGAPADLETFVQWAAWLNVGIGSFNLFLPAFPLDGGRLLRAALATRMGLAKATHTAASIGRGAAFVLGALGILSFQAGGLWLVLIALFIYLGAGAEESSMNARQALRGLTAADVMTPDPVSVRANTRLEDVVDTMTRTRHLELPVLDEGRLVGTVGLEDLADVPRDRLDDVPVETVMRPRPATVAPGTEADALLHGIQGGRRHLYVLEDDRLVGVVSTTDLERFIAILERTRR